MRGIPQCGTVAWFLLVLFAAACGQSHDDASDTAEAATGGADAGGTNPGGTAGIDAGGPGVGAGEAGAGVGGTCWELPEAPTATAEERICRDIAAAACRAMNRCMPGLPGNGAFQIPALDEETCAVRFAVGCAHALARPGVAALDELEGCAAIVEAASCEQVFDAERFGVRATARPLTVPVAVELCGVRGTHEDGEACESSLECAGGACSLPSSDGCGVCESIPSLGDECDGYFAICAPGLYCSPETFECESLAGEGEACPTGLDNASWSVGCAMGLHCVEGTCLRTRGEGEPCELDVGESPARARCDAFLELGCDPTTLTCRFERRAEHTNLCGYTPDGSECASLNPEISTCQPQCLYPALQVGYSRGARCELPLGCSQ